MVILIRLRKITEYISCKIWTFLENKVCFLLKIYDFYMVDNYHIKKEKKCRYLFHLLTCILKLFETFWLKRIFKVYVFFCSNNIYHYGCSFFSVCSQRTEHVELTSIRCRYYVQTSKTKYSRSLFLLNFNGWKVGRLLHYVLRTLNNNNGCKLLAILHSC